MEGVMKTIYANPLYEKKTANSDFSEITCLDIENAANVSSILA
jgi:hypothetical protein